MLAYVAAFFLIQADPGHADAVARQLADLPGVYGVAVTSGPYDVVAEVTPALDQQQRIRVAARAMRGMSRLCVCQGDERRRLVAS
jgi:hypothetical protein